MSATSEYVVVIDWTPLTNSVAEYRAWLAGHRLTGGDVDEDRVLIDTGRGADGDLRRIRISRGELTRLGIEIG